MIAGVKTSNGVLVNKDDALAAAWKDGQFDGFDPVTLTAILSHEDGHGISISAVFSGTLRRFVLQQREKYYVDLSQAWLSLRGTWLHKGLESVALPEGVEVMREVHLTSSVGDVVVRGTADLYIPSLASVYDLKTVNKRVRWDNLPRNTHVGQVSGYGWLLRRNGYPVRRHYLIYVNFDRYALFPISPLTDEEVEREILEAAWLIQRGMTEGYTPPLEMCNIFLCTHCPVRQVCEGLQEEGI